jgi:pimeloyl-ACP methyl ester carboxylesterase
VPTPTPPEVVSLPDGRVVTLDDVGDPAGSPVVYLHGTPGSRLARHPDDALAAAAGVRLVAPDRPGYGGSDPRPDGAGPLAYAADVAEVLDTLGIERCAVLAWSGGALDALIVAAGLGERTTSLTIAAGVVPREAYADTAVRAAAPDRADLLGLADELGPGELGDMLAPMLAPYPCDRALALEHQTEHRDPATAAELARVPGMTERMADVLVEAVRRGLAGVAADVEAQNRPFPVDLASVACPVRLWWGADDTVTPPVFGRWYAGALPGATLTVAEGAGHYLPVVRWPELLASLA